MGQKVGRMSERDILVLLIRDALDGISDDVVEQILAARGKKPNHSEVPTCLDDAAAAEVVGDLCDEGDLLEFEETLKGGLWHVRQGWPDMPQTALGARHQGWFEACQAIPFRT